MQRRPAAELLLLVLLIAATTQVVVARRNSHSWMKQVPLKKLDKKSKLTGSGVAPDDHFSSQTKFIGKKESFASAFSKNAGDEFFSDELAHKLSWDVVDADGTLYEAVLTPGTLAKMADAGGKNRRRRRSKGPHAARREQRQSPETSRAILGDDTRWNVPCGRESGNGARSAGRLSTNLDSAYGGGCSATLIGPRHVLTAGHCVHGGKDGDWIDSSYKFRPQQNCHSTHAPLGTYSWSSIYSVKAWTEESDLNYDYALIILSEDVGTWSSFGWNDGFQAETPIYIFGYPARDKLDYEMWLSTGSVSEAESLVLYSGNIDTVPGNSGSGVLYWNNYLSLIAVHSGWVEFCHPDGTCVIRNREVRITKSRFEQICGWMNTDLC